MDFGLSAEQELLQQSAREFLRHECPSALVRSVMDPARDGWPRDLYAKMAELGWLGILIPAQYGGAGGELLDAAVLCEEFGRTALPGPFFSSSVLAALTLRFAGRASHRRQYLPGLARGDSVGTLAWSEGSARFDEIDSMESRCERQRLRLCLQGTKWFVTDAHVADWFLVVCRIREGRRSDVALLLVPRDHPGVKVQPMLDADQTRRPCQVEFDNVTLPHKCWIASGERVRSTLKRVFDAASILLAADSLGGAARVLDMTVEYAQVRQQFGRPIGSFQAIQHACAEMVAAIEPARALLWYAAYAFDHEPRRASYAASMAKAHLCDVYTGAAERALRVHGGIGFTWEHDLHLWIKRSLWNRHAFGDPTFHRERVADFCGW